MEVELGGNLGNSNCCQRLVIRKMEWKSGRGGHVHEREQEAGPTITVTCRNALTPANGGA